MAEVFQGGSASELYLRVRDALLERGREVRPRGHRTLELPAVTTVLEDPTRPAPTGVGRKLVAKIGAAEATNLVGGYSDADQLVNCAKNFAMFVEGPAGHRLLGAYGPRVALQWPRVVSQLCSDRDSRQAGVTIWLGRELERPSKDVPCTLNLFYQIRDDKLEAFTTMRSQDLVWGTPYDWMQFTAAQRALAFALGVEPGRYSHHCYSMHAYVDRDDISTWSAGGDEEFEQPPAYPLPVGERLREEVALDRWRWVQQSFAAITGISSEPDVVPSAHRWYEDVLDGTQSGGRICPSCRYVLPDDQDHWPDIYAESGKVGWCTPCATGC